LQAQLDAFYRDPEVAVRAGVDAPPLKPGQRAPEADDIVAWLRARRPAPENLDRRSLELLRLVRQAIGTGSLPLARLVIHMVTPGFYEPRFIATASWERLLDVMDAAIEILVLRAEQGAKEAVLPCSASPTLPALVVDRRQQIRQARPFFATTGPPPGSAPAPTAKINKFRWSKA
jgi:hypothetical protein